MHGTLILTGEEISRLLQMEDCIEVVEGAFRMLGDGRAPAPHVLGVHVEGGGFHIKAGLLPLETPVFVTKLNANFPHNRERAGLPTIQGVIVLCDATNGFPLAVMDSVEITRMRTAAATAVAAKYLARPDSSQMAIFGCGVQAPAQARALCCVLPIMNIRCYDINAERATALARQLGSDLRIKASAAASVEAAADSADILVTCTPSERWFIGRGHVRPGSFVAAVGADNEAKQELEPEFLTGVRLVADSLAQCSTIGDLHHAIAAGLLLPDDVFGELGEVVAGLKPGRVSDEEITVFDSTGMALQDAAAAAAVYRRASVLSQTLRVKLADRSQRTTASLNDAITWGL